MKIPRLLLLALGFCALALAPSLRAQSAPPSDPIQNDAEETVVLPTFTVESETVDRYRAADAVSAVRIRTQLIETPSSISVLTRDLVDDIKPARVAEVTRYIAGVQETGGETLYLDRQIIRGFLSSGRTVDNFRDVSAQNFEEALIERIELTKGPNSLLSPEANPGGSINIVTKSPQFKRHGEITALAGEYDAQKTSLDFGNTIDEAGRFSYRLISTYQDARREFASDSKLRTSLIAPQLAWRINEATDLVVKYHYFDSKAARFPYMILDSSITERGQKPTLGPGFSRTGRNGSPSWNHLHYFVKDVTVQFSTSFNEHITTRIAAHWQYFGEDSDQAFLSLPSLADRYSPYTGRATPDQTWALLDLSAAHDAVSNPYVATDSPYYDPTALQSRADHSLGDFIKELAFQNDWVFRFETPVAKLQTVTGWAYRDWRNNNYRISGDMKPINLFDLANYDETPTWDTALSSDTRNKAESFQVFLNQRVSLFEDRLAITGGILHYETKTSNVDHASGQPPSTLDDGKEIYMGSILYRLTPAASIYYSYSTNTSPSNANFQTLWSDGKQHEVGVKTEFFNRRLSINAAYFEIEQTNLTVGNPAYYEGDFTQPQTLFRSYENHGAELEVTGAVTRNLSMIGAVAYVKMRDPFGRRATGVSDWTASALLNYRFDTGNFKGLSLTLGAVYIGERPGDGPPVDFGPLGVLNQHHHWKPRYTLVNAGVAYSWSRYAVSLSVENLGNNTDFRIGGARSGFPSEFGRNIRLAASAKF